MQQPPDCSNSENLSVSRRGFVQTIGVAAAVAAVPQVGVPDEPAKPVSESLVTKLYNSLTPTQKKSICFDWDHKDNDRGLLRTFVSNNWQITQPQIRSDFYTKKQQHLIHDVFKGMVRPARYDRFLKQLKEDSVNEWGAE